MLRSVLLVSVFAAIMGCGRENTAVDSEPDIDGAFAAQKSGKMDEAADCLMKIAEGNLDLRSTSLAFQFSEDEVKALSQQKRNLVVDAAISDTRMLKEIASYCWTKGEQKVQSGNLAEARTYFEAVEYLGTKLRGPEHIAALNMLGEYFITSSQDRLARCEGGNPKE